MDNRTVAIIDYGLGNLSSVSAAIEKVGHRPLVTADAEQIETADCLILPGVGAFGDGMNNLREKGLVTILSEQVLEKKKPILGICLGFQLFSHHSDEFGQHEGLGWIPAHVERIIPNDPTCRVPHVGWNDLNIVKAESPLLTDVEPNTVVYYVHSYHMVCEDQSILVATTNHGGTLTSMYEKDNIFGTQFHPEKSQKTGLTILRNFIEKTA